MDETAWEGRDQADVAEAYYNQPLRVENRRLKEELMALKKTLREKGISIDGNPITGPAEMQDTQIDSHAPPHLPAELHLRILSFALTSDRPIIDPFCKLTRERLLIKEKSNRPDGPRQFSLNILAVSKAFYNDGKRLFWSKNKFVFTSPEALRGFAELDFDLRTKVLDVNFRIIARYYDDEHPRKHMSTINQHPDLRKPFELPVHRRPKEPTLARQGFRTYAYLQLIDFLEAMLPPHVPSPKDGAAKSRSPLPRPRLLPNLQRLRLDFVNFSEEIFMQLPPQLHDLASHQLGSSLNELTMTGLPNDETGFRVNTELCGLLKDEGLLIDHMAVMYQPRMAANHRYGLKSLACRKDGCAYSCRVIRAMPFLAAGMNLPPHHHHNHSIGHADPDFPPAPEDPGSPPDSVYTSCRTMWKKIPIRLSEPHKRKWVLFDRVSGMPFEEVKEDLEEGLSGNINYDIDDGCFNCGEDHIFAIRESDLGSPY